MHLLRVALPSASKRNTHTQTTITTTKKLHAANRAGMKSARRTMRRSGMRRRSNTRAARNVRMHITTRFFTLNTTPKNFCSMFCLLANNFLIFVKFNVNDFSFALIANSFFFSENPYFLLNHILFHLLQTQPNCPSGSANDQARRPANPRHPKARKTPRPMRTSSRMKRKSRRRLSKKRMRKPRKRKKRRRKRKKRKRRRKKKRKKRRRRKKNKLI